MINDKNISTRKK